MSFAKIDSKLPRVYNRFFSKLSEYLMNKRLDKDLVVTLYMELYAETALRFHNYLLSDEFIRKIDEVFEVENPFSVRYAIHNYFINAVFTKQMATADLLPVASEMIHTYCSLANKYPFTLTKKDRSCIISYVKIEDMVKDTVAELIESAWETVESIYASLREEADDYLS